MESTMASSTKNDRLATDPEMCMFVLTVSMLNHEHFMEAMIDSDGSKAMQDETSSVDRLKSWDTSSYEPFEQDDYKAKVLWKKLEDEDRLARLKQFDFRCPRAQSPFQSIDDVKTAFLNGPRRGDADHAGGLDTRKSTSGG
ncbi:hypothetical protein Tco_0024591 [Tanacetum coccineum]